MQWRTNEGAKPHDAKRGRRRLRTNPDYVEDWRANGGPVLQEEAPFRLRRQSEADLGAARWNLLAWEPPWLKGHAAPFWADVPMLEGRALDVGASTDEALFRVVVRSGATFWGLRLRDGGLVIRVARGRRAAQVRVRDGRAFNPARSGLAVAVPVDVSRAGEWARVESLDTTILARKRPGRFGCTTAYAPETWRRERPAA